jgi:DNA-binding transcriptional LysR family regulator
MDTVLVRTFLEVLTAGNFQNAAKRLFVTQSAVSLRIKRLEEELGRELFERNKTGAELTPAGETFERFARSTLKLWEEAKYQVAVPEGLDSLLMVGCQYSLWPRLGMRWLRMMEQELPTTAIKAQVGMPDRLLRLMLDGIIDIGVMYTPELRPGLEVRPLMEDKLVLASTEPDYPPDLDERYISVEWSPEFISLQAKHFPHHTNSRVSLALGSLAVQYVVRNKRAAYFPARAIETQIANGELHIVAEAPAFSFPAYVVWNPDKDEDVTENGLEILRRAAKDAEEEQKEMIEGAGVHEMDNGLSTDLFN